MAIDKIISEWKSKSFKPLYWIEGEEDFDIDRVIDYAEHRILTEEEASFNKSVFYGKDAAWTDIVNVCRRYPMFADKQVVIIKEAQHFKDIDKLELYISNPLESTILVIAYKQKKLDSRTKFAKQIKEHGVVVTTKKMFDNKLPEWVNKHLEAAGYTITAKANALLVDHIGNDLSRIKNELEKLIINLGARKKITEDDIENYIGISKEYNIFELQSAMAGKNFYKAMKIVNYFGSNPKAAPMPLLFANLYSFFSKVYMIFGLGAGVNVASAIGVTPYRESEYQQAAKLYGFNGVEQALLLLHQYNLKGIGINRSSASDEDLLKEMVTKILL